MFVKLKVRLRADELYTHTMQVYRYKLQWDGKIAFRLERKLHYFTPTLRLGHHDAYMEISFKTNEKINNEIHSKSN